MSFDYEKASGSTSHREFISLSEPTDLHFGIDVTELNEEDRINLTVELARARKVYDNAVAALMNDYDVNKNFRNFKPSGMTNIESENIYG